MTLIKRIKDYINMILSGKAESEFDVVPISSERMIKYLKYCSDIYNGCPAWEEKDISTINFAKAISSEAARLATLAINIKIDGNSARADYLQSKFDEEAYFNLRHWVEFGLGYGTVILKPNGKTIDVYTPDEFFITDFEGDKITGAVFQTQAIQNGKYFTRYEYHRFEDERYIVSNRCFVSKSEGGDGKPVAIEYTPWQGLKDEVTIQNLDRPLFGVFKTPQANNIDKNSPYGLPIYADALEELCDLDIAYSRNAKEIYDSKRIVIMDGDRFIAKMPGANKIISAGNFEAIRESMNLPDYIQSVNGTIGDGDIYHEINPALETDKRIIGINSLLSQIGYKCGFSNGYFVFNEKQGLTTATQIESEEQRTIQLIKDIRDKIENCIDGLVYALDKFADLYDDAPVGEYEIFYDFGDITYNVEEDRNRWYSYVLAGKMPYWRYLVKFEGFTEEEAKEIEAETKITTELFGGTEE